MGHWMIFLLGCWLGCIAGFLIAGLAAASGSDASRSRSVPGSLERGSQISLAGVLRDEVAG